MTELARLQAFCERHGLGWSDEAAGRFAAYVGLLEQFNAGMNLIGPMDRAEIEAQLLIDSVAAAVAAPPQGAMLDVGTGAGLPGIPLKILFADRPLTLVEPRQKRATFLRIAANRLKLTDITVHSARIEEVELAPHDWVISKAFRAPTEWLETALPLTAPGGQIVCLHAADAIEALRAQAQELGLRQISYIADVREDLRAPVPPLRSVSVFGRDG